MTQATSTQPAAPHAAGEPAPEGRSRTRRLVVGGLVAVFVVLTTAMWTYALWGPRTDPPGTLDDPAFALAAEPVCEATLARIDALPHAFESPTPEARAEVLATANADLRDQLDALGELVPPSGEDRRRVTEWLADWDVYLGDREAYAAELATGQDARFVETEKAGDHISQALEFFATVNDMPTCAPPGDVG